MKIRHLFKVFRFLISPMELDKIVASLHPLERKVVSVLSKATDVPSIMKETKLKDVEVITYPPSIPRAEKI